MFMGMALLGFPSLLGIYAMVYLYITNITFWSTESYLLGVQVRNMKMVFNIYGTWRRVTFEKLMLKIYDFFLFG